nr:tRNA guanosine(15) transglycosylase TgtA [Candidatus Njordarchaeum guaymaensis]
MVFEVRHKDVAGRIGKLATKTGVVETPVLLPVVNPFASFGIPPPVLESEFGCEAIITNAYFLWKKCKEDAVKSGIHKLLNFSKSIMTDSGAYQLLVYGNVDISPSEVIAFQEDIKSDIAVILDVPTGGREKRERATFTVEETVRRAREWAKIRRESGTLWVGPVQGGTYSDLVEKCANEVGKLGFDIHAIGSPTQIMETYKFDKLVDLIVTAKVNLPIERPTHLFGAGHPSMLSLAVALGCDIFDSASYILYAKDDRYMTSFGTRKLLELKEKICRCPACEKFTLTEMITLPDEERFNVVARHNLYLCLNEIQVIKQAIYEGRLWELVEVRARTHPQLLEGLKRLRRYRGYLEKYSPAVKPHAIFYSGPESLLRPEVTRHLTKLDSVPVPHPAEVLVILPEPPRRPFSKTKEQRKYRKIIRSVMSGNQLRKVHVCTVSKFFGLVPMELDETYPLAQHEVPRTPDMESKKLISHTIRTYIKNHTYKAAVIHVEHRVLPKGVVKKILDMCLQLGMYAVATPKEPVNPRSKGALGELRDALLEAHKATAASLEKKPI